MSVTDLIIYVIPGFVSMIVIEFVSSKIPVTDIKFVAYSLILTGINFTILRLLFYTTSKRYREKRQITINHQHPFVYSLILLISILSGTIIGYALEMGFIYGITKHMPLVNSLNMVSYDSPKSHLITKNMRGRFYENKKSEAWVEIKIHSGTTYEGWIRYHVPDNTQYSELYLEPFCTKQKSADLIYEKEKGIIIFEEQISTIVFMPREHSQCFNLHGQQTSLPPLTPAP